MYRLENWSIVIKNPDPYQPPELTKEEKLMFEQMYIIEKLNKERGFTLS